MAEQPSASPCTHPSIGVGTWAWGNQLLWGYDPAQDGQLEACFRRAVELGLRFFDTADSYGTGRLNGRSETLLGSFCSALPEAQRRQITVATKLAPFPWRLGRGGYGKAFAASHRRLQGKLDRVQLHWSTARYAPWQETPLLEGLADLVQQGLVGELGVSNLGPLRLVQVHHLLAARGVRLSSLQVQLSLLSPEAIGPQGVASICTRLGIELIAYSPLALGLLGRWPGESPTFPPGPEGSAVSKTLAESTTVVAWHRKDRHRTGSRTWGRGPELVPGPWSPSHCRDAYPCPCRRSGSGFVLAHERRRKDDAGPTGPCIIGSNARQSLPEPVSDHNE
jgi:pyridoxine 4-dehydrogenase